MILPTRLEKWTKKIVAAGLALSLAIIDPISFSTLFAQVSSEDRAALSFLPKEFSNTLARLPKEWGEVDEIFGAPHPSSPFVVLLQDAHSIPAAQKSLKHLVEFLTTQSGIRTVALEGAAGKLDPTFFYAYPDKEKLKKNFDETLDRGELSGAAAASVFDKTGAQFFGVEDQSLYEEGIRAYLNARGESKALLEKIEEEKKSLEGQKKKIYSVPLLTFDRALTEFKKNPEALFEILEIAKKEKISIDSFPQLEAFHKEIRNQKKIDFRITQEINALVKNAGERARTLEFQSQYQDYRTERISAGEFAAYLAHSLNANFSRRLSDLIRRQERLSQIQGPPFYKEFHAFVTHAKSLLIRTPEERSLDIRNHELDLLEKLVRLELTREEWTEVKRLKRSKVKKFSSGLNLLTFKPINFLTNLAFYENAELREQAMLRNLLSRDTRHASPAALLVTGGFHTQGLIETFKRQGISYALIRPAIREIPKENLYQNHMRGEVSWKNYFRVHNGRINLYEAFARYTRDQLLADSVERIADRKTNPKDSLYAKRYPLNAKLLKPWRDQIIRNLAEENRIEASGDYTRFLDEVTDHRPQTIDHRQRQKQKLRSEWFAKVEKFIDGLKILKTENRLTPENIMRLVNQPTIVPENAVGVFRPELNSPTKLLLPSRSELRTDHKGRVRRLRKPSASPRTQSLTSRKNPLPGGKIEGNHFAPRVAPKEWWLSVPPDRLKRLVARSKISQIISLSVLVGKRLKKIILERIQNEHLGIFNQFFAEDSDAVQFPFVAFAYQLLLSFPGNFFSPQWLAAVVEDHLRRTNPEDMKDDESVIPLAHYMVPIIYEALTGLQPPKSSNVRSRPPVRSEARGVTKKNTPPSWKKIAWGFGGSSSDSRIPSQEVLIVDNEKLNPQYLRTLARGGRPVYFYYPNVNALPLSKMFADPDSWIHHIDGIITEEAMPEITAATMRTHNLSFITLGEAQVNDTSYDRPLSLGDIVRIDWRNGILYQKIEFISPDSSARSEARQEPRKLAVPDLWESDRSEARMKDKAKSYILRPEYIGLFLFMGLHGAFILSSQLIEMIKSESALKFLSFFVLEISVALLAGFVAVRTQVAIHEGAHYIEAKKKGMLMGQPDTEGKEVIISLRERLEIFFAILMGKFQKDKSGYAGAEWDEKGNISVSSKRPDVAIRSAGPKASLKTAQWFLPPSIFFTALAFGIGKTLSIFWALPFIGFASYAFALAAIGFASYRHTDDNAYEEAKALKNKKEQHQKIDQQITQEEVAKNDERRRELSAQIFDGALLKKFKSVNGSIAHQPLQDRNVMQGGQHAVIKRKVKDANGKVYKIQFPRGNLTNQEIKIIPNPAISLSDMNAMVRDIQNLIETKLLGADASQGLQYVGIGNEGGVLGIYRAYESQALQILTEAVKEAGYEPGKDVFYSLDVAASELAKFYQHNVRDQKGMYEFYMQGERKKVDSQGLVDYLVELIDEFPWIVMIEDGMSEDDIEGWKILRKATYKKGILLVADDLATTNEDTLRELMNIKVDMEDGTETSLFDILLLKVNQIGTLTEAMLAAKVVEESGLKTQTSHRSGKSVDVIEGEFSFALPHNIAIKTGGGQLSDRQIIFEYLEEEENEAALGVPIGKIEGDPTISYFHAKEILTGDGRPTMGLFMRLSDGRHFVARVPVGASAGEGEAQHLTDGDLSRYDGAGNLKVAEFLNEEIAPVVLNKKLSELESELGLKSLIDVDRWLLGEEKKLAVSNNHSFDELPRAEQKKALQMKEFFGANGTLPVSIVFGRLFAATEGLRSWEYFQKVYEELGAGDALDQNRDYLYGFSNAGSNGNGPLVKASSQNVLRSELRTEDSPISISEAEKELGLPEGSIETRYPASRFEAILDFAKENPVRSRRVTGYLIIQEKGDPKKSKKFIIKKPNILSSNTSEANLNEGNIASQAAALHLGPDILYASSELLIEELLPQGYELSSRGILFSRAEAAAFGRVLAEAFHKMVTESQVLYYANIPQTHIFVLGFLHPEDGNLKVRFVDWSNSFVGRKKVLDRSNQLKVLEQYAYLIKTFLAKPEHNVLAWKNFQIRLIELQDQMSGREKFSYEDLLTSLEGSLVSNRRLSLSIRNSWEDFFDKAGKVRAVGKIARIYTSKEFVRELQRKDARSNQKSRILLETEGRRAVRLILQHDLFIDTEIAERIAVDLFERGYLGDLHVPKEELLQHLQLFLRSQGVSENKIEAILKPLHYMTGAEGSEGLTDSYFLRHYLTTALRDQGIQPGNIPKDFVHYLSQQESRRIAVRTEILPNMRNRDSGQVLQIYFEEDPEPFKVYAIKGRHKNGLGERHRSQIASDLELGPHVIYTREKSPGKEALIIEDWLPKESNIRNVNANKFSQDPQSLDLLAESLALKIYTMVDPKRGDGTVLHKFDNAPEHLYIIETDFLMIDWGFNSELSKHWEYDFDPVKHLIDILGLLKGEFQKFGPEFWAKFQTNIIGLAENNGAFVREFQEAFQQVDVKGLLEKQRLEQKKVSARSEDSRSEARQDSTRDLWKGYVSPSTERLAWFVQEMRKKYINRIVIRKANGEETTKDIHLLQSSEISRLAASGSSGFLFQLDGDGTLNIWHAPNNFSDGQFISSIEELAWKTMRNMAHGDKNALRLFQYGAAGKMLRHTLERALKEKNISSLPTDDSEIVAYGLTPEQLGLEPKGNSETSRKFLIVFNQGKKTDLQGDGSSKAYAIILEGLKKLLGEEVKEGQIVQVSDLFLRSNASAVAADPSYGIYKRIDYSEIEDSGLPVGPPAPENLQLLSLETVQIPDFIHYLELAVKGELLKGQGSKEPMKQLKEWILGRIQNGKLTREAKSIIYQTAREINSKVAIHHFGEEGIPAVMAFLAVLNPQTLELTKVWNQNVYQGLGGFFEDPENSPLIQKGRLTVHEVEPLSALELSIGYKKRRVFFAFHFSKNHPAVDGKVPIRMKEIQAFGLGDLTYRVWDWMLKKNYPTVHTRQGMQDQKYWAQGIPMIPGKKDSYGYLQNGWRFQALEFKKTPPIQPDRTKNGTFTEAAPARSELRERVELLLLIESAIDAFTALSRDDLDANNELILDVLTTARKKSEDPKEVRRLIRMIFEDTLIPPHNIAYIKKAEKTLQKIEDKAFSLLPEDEQQRIKDAATQRMKVFPGKNRRRSEARTVKVIHKEDLDKIYEQLKDAKRGEVTETSLDGKVLYQYKTAAGTYFFSQSYQQRENPNTGELFIEGELLIEIEKDGFRTKIATLLDNNYWYGDLINLLIFKSRSEARNKLVRDVIEVLKNAPKDSIEQVADDYTYRRGDIIYVFGHRLERKPDGKVEANPVTIKIFKKGELEPKVNINVTVEDSLNYAALVTQLDSKSRSARSEMRTESEEVRSHATHHTREYSDKMGFTVLRESEDEKLIDEILVKMAVNTTVSAKGIVEAIVTSKNPTERAKGIVRMERILNHYILDLLKERGGFLSIWNPRENVTIYYEVLPTFGENKEKIRILQEVMLQKLKGRPIISSKSRARSAYPEAPSPLARAIEKASTKVNQINPQHLNGNKEFILNNLDRAKNSNDPAIMRRETIEALAMFPKGNNPILGAARQALTEFLELIPKDVRKTSVRSRSTRSELRADIVEEKLPPDDMSQSYATRYSQYHSRVNEVLNQQLPFWIELNERRSIEAQVIAELEKDRIFFRANSPNANHLTEIYLNHIFLIGQVYVIRVSPEGNKSLVVFMHGESKQELLWADASSGGFKAVGQNFFKQESDNRYIVVLNDLMAPSRNGTIKPKLVAETPVNFEEDEYSMINKAVKELEERMAKSLKQARNGEKISNRIIAGQRRYLERLEALIHQAIKNREKSLLEPEIAGLWLLNLSRLEGILLRLKAQRKILRMELQPAGEFEAYYAVVHESAEALEERLKDVVEHFENVSQESLEFWRTWQRRLELAHDYLFQVKGLTNVEHENHLKELENIFSSADVNIEIATERWVNFKKDREEINFNQVIRTAAFRITEKLDEFMTQLGTNGSELTERDREDIINSLAGLKGEIDAWLKRPTSDEAFILELLKAITDARNTIDLDLSGVPEDSKTHDIVTYLVDITREWHSLYASSGRSEVPLPRAEARTLRVSPFTARSEARPSANALGQQNLLGAGRSEMRKAAIKDIGEIMARGKQLSEPLALRFLSALSFDDPAWAAEIKFTLEDSAPSYVAAHQNPEYTSLQNEQAVRVAENLLNLKENTFVRFLLSPYENADNREVLWKDLLKTTHTLIKNNDIREANQSQERLKVRLVVMTQKEKGGLIKLGLKLSSEQTGNVLSGIEIMTEKEDRAQPIAHPAYSSVSIIPNAAQEAQRGKQFFWVDSTHSAEGTLFDARVTPSILLLGSLSVVALTKEQSKDLLMLHDNLAFLKDEALGTLELLALQFADSARAEARIHSAA